MTESGRKLVNNCMLFRDEWHFLNKRGAKNRTEGFSLLLIGLGQRFLLKGRSRSWSVYTCGKLLQPRLTSPDNLLPAVKTFCDDRLFVTCPIAFLETISTLTARVLSLQLWLTPVTRVVKAQSGYWTNTMGFFFSKGKDAWKLLSRPPMWSPSLRWTKLAVSLLFSLWNGGWEWACWCTVVHIMRSFRHRSTIQSAP